MFKAPKLENKIIGEYFTLINNSTLRPLIKVLSETDEYIDVEFIRDYLYANPPQNMKYESFSMIHRPLFFRDLKDRSFIRLMKCDKEYLKQCGIDLQHESDFYSSLEDIIKTMSC